MYFVYYILLPLLVIKCAGMSKTWLHIKIFENRIYLFYYANILWKTNFPKFKLDFIYLVLISARAL